MPHKRNPIRRRHRRPGGQQLHHRRFENVALWHERDISHVNERMSARRSVTLHFMLREMTAVVKGWASLPRTCADERARRVFSQRVLLALWTAG